LSLFGVDLVSVTAKSLDYVHTVFVVIDVFWSVYGRIPYISSMRQLLYIQQAGLSALILSLHIIRPAIPVPSCLITEGCTVHCCHKRTWLSQWHMFLKWGLKLCHVL